MSIFRFGEPSSAITTASIYDWRGIDLTDASGYYLPPISLSGLAKLVKANPHHGTLPFFKANLLAKYLLPHSFVTKKILRKAAIDFCTFGNAYLKIIKNVAGQTIGLTHLPAINMRRKPNNLYCYLNKDGTITDFQLGEVIHLMDEDPEQSIYGVPYWFGALQSILLSEDARLFFRRFFKNGAKTGLAFATSGLTTKEQDKLDECITGIKEDGSFKTITLHFPNGDIDKMIKGVPFSTDGAKIEYSKFMGISATEICEAWRIRPELAGMMPSNAGGTGDLEKIMKMYHLYELMPFQDVFLEINEFLPYTLPIKFENPYQNTLQTV